MLLKTSLSNSSNVENDISEDDMIKKEIPELIIEDYVSVISLPNILFYDAHKNQWVSLGF